jgi:hemoglobin
MNPPTISKRSDAMATSTAPTLFERLGGAASIGAAVDLFYDRVLADPALAPFFDGVDAARLRAHQRAFLTMALGGPRDYDGRNLTDAHRNLDIGDQEFNLVAGHLTAVLNELEVPSELADETLTAVAGLRDVVLGRA